MPRIGLSNGPPHQALHIRIQAHVISLKVADFDAGQCDLFFDAIFLTNAMIQIIKCARAHRQKAVTLKA